MKPAATTKEEILAACRDLMSRQTGSLNLRELAAVCGISVGTLYNYFGSKSELAAAAVESVWQDVFRCQEGSFAGTEACIRWLFGRMEYGSQRYPGFLTLHAAAFGSGGKPEGKARMEAAWAHCTEMLCRVLCQDPRVRPVAFDGTFTPACFAGILFSLLLAAQLQGCFDPAPALELTRRLLY